MQLDKEFKSKTYLCINCWIFYFIPFIYRSIYLSIKIALYESILIMNYTIDKIKINMEYKIINKYSGLNKWINEEDR